MLEERGTGREIKLKGNIWMNSAKRMKTGHQRVVKRKEREKKEASIKGGKEDSTTGNCESNNERAVFKGGRGMVALNGGG